jgi:hypothetical protein
MLELFNEYGILMTKNEDTKTCWTIARNALNDTGMAGAENK